MTEEPVSALVAEKLAVLFQWQKTRDFSRHVAKLDEEIEVDLLIGGRWKPLREALILRDLATTLGYQECRLEYGEFPDGVLRSAGDELQVEITEVLTPGRKRDEEYRRLKESASPTSLSHHDSREVREAGERWVDWIVAAVKKKLKYSNRLKFDIVVYNNIDHLFELPEMTELSQQIGSLLAEVGYRDHWVWQVRSTTVDLLWPRVLRLKIPDWEERF